MTGVFSGTRGLRVQLDLGLLFMRTLHTGRSFSAGIRDFVVPTLAALEDALGFTRGARTTIARIYGRCASWRHVENRS